MKPYYDDGQIVLYHGDALELIDWLDADVLVTDPPYGVAWATGSMYNTVRGGKGWARVDNAVAGDKTPEARDKALELWGARPAIVFGSWRVDRPANIRQRLIWHKMGSNPGMTTAPWFSADEEIYVIGDGFGGKPSQTVYPTTEQRGGKYGAVANSGHPTPKPVGLMEKLIEKCPPGVIADPFAGSGSTLVAARNVGRRAIGVELEERYCELTAKRLAQGVFDFGELE